jgi:hypothetical protein
MEDQQYNGYCICVHCNTKYPHVKKQPCRNKTCPECGRALMREGSYHHQLFLKKIGDRSYENGNSDKG